MYQLIVKNNISSPIREFGTNYSVFQIVLTDKNDYPRIQTFVNADYDAMDSEIGKISIRLEKKEKISSIVQILLANDLIDKKTSETISNTLNLSLNNSVFNASESLSATLQPISSSPSMFTFNQNPTNSDQTQRSTELIPENSIDTVRSIVAIAILKIVLDQVVRSIKYIWNLYTFVNEGKITLHDSFDSWEPFKLQLDAVVNLELKEINLSVRLSNITDENWQHLLSILKKPHLKGVEFSNYYAFVNLDLGRWKDLCSVFAQPNITLLTFNDQELTNNQWQLLSEALSKSKIETITNLSTPLLGNWVFFRSILKIPTLKTVGLKICSLSDSNEQQLSDALSQSNIISLSCKILVNYSISEWSCFCNGLAKSKLEKLKFIDTLNYLQLFLLNSAIQNNFTLIEINIYPEISTNIHATLKRNKIRKIESLLLMLETTLSSLEANEHPNLDSINDLIESQQLSDLVIKVGEPIYIKEFKELKNRYQFLMFEGIYISERNNRKSSIVAALKAIPFLFDSEDKLITTFNSDQRKIVNGILRGAINLHKPLNDISKEGSVEETQQGYIALLQYIVLSNIKLLLDFSESDPKKKSPFWKTAPSSSEINGQLKKVITEGFNPIVLKELNSGETDKVNAVFQQVLSLWRGNPPTRQKKQLDTIDQISSLLKVLCPESEVPVINQVSERLPSPSLCL